ncbi:hypothetical protein J2S43_004484 [Catenuloplanes nepalensis]|uniref:PNPLA domain-containing protein n=1 Tax=Catenuloplanes nepalensis TaxID=587533 RepID=A0ABT9MX02_9ACTN|nr:hypothetical protein [Catenuloplanes nepalensis]MDP9795972.1 hypothetical protein [Catenuloplanes nepalensis]
MRLRALPWLALIVAGVAGIAMREASGLLGRLQQAGAPSYGMGALTGWPGPPWEHRAITGAVTAWSERTVGTDLHGPALAWVHWYAALAAVLFLPACGILLLTAVRAVGFEGGAARWHVLPAVLAAEAEALWTPVVAGGLDGSPHGLAALVSALLSAVKWIALAIAGGAILVRWLAADVGPPRPFAGDRVWRRHHVQLIAVAVLFLAFAAPLGGPLDQGPDIVRAWADPNFTPVRVLGPLTGTLLLCVALWTAGRWALLDGVGPAREPGRWQLTLIAGAAAALLFGALRLTGFDTGLNLLGIALVLAVIGGVNGALGARASSASHTDLPGDRWGRVSRLGRCLSVAPLVALGMLLVRAFSGPVLLSGAAGMPVRAAWGWLLAGVVLAVVVAPASAWGAGVLERRWVDRSARRKRWVPHQVGAAVLGAGVVVAVTGAVDPLAAGRGVRVIGLLTVALATLVVAFGFVRRRAEQRLPTRLFSRARRTPVLALSLVTVLVAGQVDAGRYHDVPMVAGASAGIAGDDGNALEGAFEEWLRNAGACAPGAGAGEIEAGRPVVPLVLVAAPSGGSRAAYWTAAALDDLTDPELQRRALAPETAGAACGDRAIFAISGVSGGSLGAAVWATSRDGARTESPGRTEAAAGVPVSEEPLAALLAAGFYRDLPHMLHGIDGRGTRHIADRARILETGWERANPALAADLATVAPATGTWRPLLLFNGTAVETGCRVVVAPIPAAVTAERRGDALASCRAAAGPARGNGSGRFAVGALDAQDYLGCTGDASLRLSTAALLSARFPYFTPTGRMRHCNPDGTVAETFGVDGGYLETNGIALALDLWRALEPVVAAHNRAPAGRPLIAPMLVVLDNHYQRYGAPTATDRPAELIAPLTALQAPRTAQTGPIQLQDALLELSGPLPGLGPGRLRAGDDPCGDSRVFRLAPDAHPGVEAPLGWVLSDAAQHDLRTELRTQTAAGAPCAAVAGRAAGSLVPALEPGGMATVLQMLGGALRLTAS